LRVTDFTDRERAVAVLVADGLTNDDIARRLGIASKTVEWNLTRLYRKLGVSSRTQLAVAVTRGSGDFPWAARGDELSRTDLVGTEPPRDASREDDDEGTGR
jgi:DNA-binding CsgD family transcriptional regulator